MYEHITVTQSGSVAHIRLNRPDRMNTLGIGPGSSRDEIASAAQRADDDDAVGCILLTAEGRAFCAGGDLTGVESAETPYGEFVFMRSLTEFYRRLRDIRAPIVAAVNGLCLGAGMGLVAQCDLVIAGDDARFGLVEGRIGHPGATEIVPIVGPAWAKFLILTGELIDAEHARDIGLALTVLPAAELTDRAADLARRIARVPREAAILNKAAVDAMTDAMGRHAGRLAGHAYDVTTKGAANTATAPDGRRFADIVAEEGIAGLKKARDSQFTGPWLPRRSPQSTPIPTSIEEEPW